MKTGICLIIYLRRKKSVKYVKVAGQTGNCYWIRLIPVFDYNNLKETPNDGVDSRREKQNFHFLESEMEKSNSWHAHIVFVFQLFSIMCKKLFQFHQLHCWCIEYENSWTVYPVSWFISSD